MERQAGGGLRSRPIPDERLEEVLRVGTRCRHVGAGVWTDAHAPDVSGRQIRGQNRRERLLAGIARANLAPKYPPTPPLPMIANLDVLEGTCEYTVEGKPPVTLRAGNVLFIPAGTIHSARNVGTGRGVELATYIVEKGKPLLTVVD
jgi:Cupin domain